MTTDNHMLHFTDREIERINAARVLVSAGDFHLTYSQFLHDLIMQGIDEIEGVDQALARSRARGHREAYKAAEAHFSAHQG